MTDVGFPVEAALVIATMAQVLEHGKRPDLAAILRASTATIEEVGYDGYGDGTTYYALRLSVPTEMFATIRATLEAVERELLDLAQLTTRTTAGARITEAVITPTLELSHGRAPSASVSDTTRIWGPGFRLFLSHVSTHKRQAAALRDALRLYGVSAFVAHEDIEPTREWQREIELAMSSADALCAVITDDFHGRIWTDQEVGYALGRGLFVLSLRCGSAPSGFIGRNQAFPWIVEQSPVPAADLVQILLSQDGTAAAMRDGLIEALESSPTFDTSQTLSLLVTNSAGFSVAQRARVVASIESNFQVEGARGVARRLRLWAAGSEVPPSP